MQYEQCFIKKIISEFILIYLLKIFKCGIC